jgi:hypothetical protein
MNVAPETETGQPDETDQQVDDQPATESIDSQAAAATPVQSPPHGTRAENNVSSIVRTPGISIRESLRGSQEKKTPVDSTLSEPVDDIRTEPEDMDLPEEKVSVSADPGAIVSAWNQYASSIEKSKPRIYSTLIHHKPDVKADGSVMVLLNSEAQRDHFMKHIRKDLQKFIQNATGLSGVEIITEVSETAQNGTKIYTEQDKLDFLVSKNPELGKLRSRFNLDFDD